MRLSELIDRLQDIARERESDPEVLLVTLNDSYSIGVVEVVVNGGIQYVQIETQEQEEWEP